MIIIKKIKDKFTDIQFLRFALVGVSNTAVSYAAYLITIWLSSGRYILGNIMGFIVSTFNAYILNSKFVFKKRTDKINISHLLKTFLSYGITFFANTALLYMLVDVLDVSKLIAPLIDSAIIFSTNFVLNKFWVYGAGRGEKNAD